MENEEYDGLHPFSDLPHPIIVKASELIGEGSHARDVCQQIHCATKLPLFEIRSSQWRGGVWIAEDGVAWLVVAGLAKGNHLDHDDFYQQVERENTHTDLTQWLPSGRDIHLLKRETAARLRTEWELEIQRSVLSALSQVHSGGTSSFQVPQIPPGLGEFATVTIHVVLERGDDEDSSIATDDVVVEIDPDERFMSHSILWVAILRILTSISPPQQEWDSTGLVFSNIGEPGAWTERVRSLGKLVERQELEDSQPGRVSHYTHKKHLALKTVEGKAVFSLCGKAFVPISDHASLPECPECRNIYESLPPI